MTKFGFFKLLLPYSLQAHQNNLALKKNSRSQGFSFCNEKVERERERERKGSRKERSGELEILTKNPSKVLGLWNQL
jgi:hypothetical protein